LVTKQLHLELSRLLSDMNREIERGNNINLTNLLTRLWNVFPLEQQQAAATIHQALIAATAHVTQRDTPRRTEPKDHPVEEDSYTHCKNKPKHYYEQGPWERVLRAVNDLKSEIGGFRRLLVEHGIMHEGPPRRTNRRALLAKRT
jgi:hypothetical protein